MKETIHIYHTNDLHSHFEHWSRIRDLMKDRRLLHEGEGDEVFAFDIGDHVDRSHPLTEATLGKGNIKFLNEAGYDGVTIGNNEGITLDHEELNHLYDEAAFPVILGNLFDESMALPDWASPYQIYRTKGGVKIGVLGLTAPFYPFYQALGWTVTEPIAELRKLLDELRPKVDVLILLSHLGIRDDEWIGEEFPEVDVILGAHTHHILHEGKEVNGTLLGAAGKYGNFVGHMVIEVDSSSKKILTRKAGLYAYEDLPESGVELDEERGWVLDGQALLEEEIADLKTGLSVDWYAPSPLPLLLSEALMEWTDADCSFVNAGLLMEGLQKGAVTKRDLHHILPHPINPCLITLTGEELKEIITLTLNESWPALEVKGLGFRGRVLGQFVYTNISFTEGDLLVGGEHLDPHESYKVALPDMFTFGHFFPSLKTKTKKYFMPEFLRDVLGWKLGKMKN
ncbi:bifunctional metallophosphatase/5'-nucleotidase [Rossellomorea marisflavi]|uniref:bifunctional metallophosphatase/5'-nucleotidase n=1 Tax=Rossellomorea marisflavi TaxID=189381 RepID=UPI003D2ECD19